MHRNAIETLRGVGAQTVRNLFTGNSDEFAEDGQSDEKWKSLNGEVRTAVRETLAEIVELAGDPDETLLLERLAMINSRSMRASAMIMQVPTSVIATRTANMVAQAEAQNFIRNLFGDDGPSILVLGL